MYARLSEMSEMVLGCTTETVEIPLGNFVGLEEQRRPGEQREAWKTEANREEADGLALLNLVN
jgi:hypothetical protein